MGSFKDLFIKPSEEGGTQEPPKQQVSTSATVVQQPQAIQPAQVSVSSTNPAPVITYSSSGPDEKIREAVWQILIDHNLPGPDYLELKQVVSGLMGMNLPEAQTWEAAFRMIASQSSGFTKSVALQSIETYRGLAENERAIGLKEADDKYKLEVESKNAKIEGLRIEVSTFDQQLADLQKKYEEDRQKLMDRKASLDAEIQNLSTEVATATAEIDSRKAVFNASVDSVISQLDLDKNIINSLNI